MRYIECLFSNHPFSTFRFPFRIVVVGGDKDFKFDKFRRDQGHVTHLKFCGPNNISALAEARVVKFCTQVD